MADEEVEDGNDGEAASPTESKNASLEEFGSKSSTIENGAEETSDKIEDGTTLNDEDVERTNGESDKVNGEPGEDEETITSTEKIERPSKDSKDASLEKASTSASKLTDVDEEGEEASMKKKKLEKQQVQKGRRLQCGRQFRAIIGKQELRKEELEKREGDLRTRLDVLECSMPAVMVWNVWQKMSQGGPVPNLHRLMEKQFRAPEAGELCCPSTPSQHYDCRVREVEADRKEARRRLDEARELWLEKEARLKERRDKLEEAKKVQEERKEKIERLTKEANELREALRKMDEEATAEDERMMSGACESGECGDIRCREGWLRGVSSVDSIKTVDVECLARLRELAESELMMKKQIAELERREETYMRTLQRADDMWSKMDGDTADTLGGLQFQLDSKTSVNQQLASRICELEDELEKLRKRMALCRSELTKYTSIGKIEALIGRDDDFAKTTDIMLESKPKVAGEDKESSAKIDVEDKEVSPDQIAPATGIPPTGEPMEPEKIDKMQKYLAMLGSMEELYYDDDYGVCGPEYACHEEDWPGTDEELSATDIGSTSLISEKVLSVSRADTEAGVSRDIDESDTIEQKAESGEAEVTFKLEEDSIEEGEKFEEVYEEAEESIEHYVETQEVHEEVKDVEEVYEDIKEVDDVAPIDVESDNVTVPLNKLQSWVNTVDSIRLVISKCSTCSAIKDDADTLAKDIAVYAGVEAKEVITEIIPELTTIETKDDEVAMEKIAIDGETVDEEKAIPESVTEVKDEIETMPKVDDSMKVEPVVGAVDEPVVQTLIDSVTEVIEEPVAELAIEPTAEEVIHEETQLKPIDEVTIKEETTDEETTIIVPIEKLSDGEEIPSVKEEAPSVDIPTAEVKEEVEETKMDDETTIDEDTVGERIGPPEEVEEIEVEKLVTVETEDITRDVAEEELESEDVPKLEMEEAPVPAEEPTEKVEAVTVPPAEEVFVDTETIEFKEEIPMEEDAKLIEPERVSLEEKTEEVEEKVSLVDEKSIKIEKDEEIKEEALMEKEMPILEKPEIEEKRKIPIDPKIVTTPYLAVADIEEIKEEPPDAEKLPCVCKRVEEPTRPPTLPAMQIVITQTEFVQTVVNRGTQTWTVHLIPIKVPDQRSMETDARDPEISSRKMRWRMRPKNRSAIPSSNVSSQTEKPLLVLQSTTQDLGSSEQQRLLCNILQSLRSSQSNEEKEIRSINYGHKPHGTDKCDCCVCGKARVTPRAPILTGSHPCEKLPKVRISKVDRITQDANLHCEVPKSGTKEKQRTGTTKSVKQVCDRGICTCPPSAFKGTLRTSYKKVSTSEKRDQSCLVKISKGKRRSSERKKDVKEGITSCGTRCTKDGTATNGTARETKEATDSPSSCMCTKMEKTSSGQLRKLQICACGDSD